ncbi:hypothetical protein PDJ95_08565 [Bacillus cereus]|nr:hypothetical protein [Bacillus cereus]
MTTLKEALQVVHDAGYTSKSPAQQQSHKAYKVNQVEVDERWFAMQDTQNYELIKDKLTQGQKGVLLLLTTAMQVKKGGALYKGRYERLTVEGVATMIGKKRTQTHTILTELECLGVITKEQSGKNVFLSINEAFYLCGWRDHTRPVVKIFKKRLQEVAGLLTLNEMGFLSDILSHMHWETHILCSNPSEHDASQLEVWRAKDVVSELGYSRNFVSATLRKFRQNRITVEIGTVIDVICLDPALVSKQSKAITLVDIIEVAQQIHLSKDNFKK